MDYKKIKKGKKFDEFLKENYLPNMQIGDLDIYYIGKGFFVGTDDKFIKNVRYFSKKEFVEKKLYAKLDFEINENNIEKSFVLEEGLSTSMSFNEVKQYLKANGMKYIEGAEYDFKGEFICLWIDYCKNYKFYFFGRSKKTKMGAFDYYLHEE